MVFFNKTLAWTGVRVNLSSFFARRTDSVSVLLNPKGNVSSSAGSRFQLGVFVASNGLEEDRREQLVL
jgi:hypothetical protein